MKTRVAMSMIASIKKHRKDKTINENEGALSSRKQIWMKFESEAVMPCY